MATKKETYTEAMKRLEAIVAQIESNELDIDELARVGGPAQGSTTSDKVLQGKAL